MCSESPPRRSVLVDRLAIDPAASLVRSCCHNMCLSYERPGSVERHVVATQPGHKLFVAAAHQDNNESLRLHVGISY